MAIKWFLIAACAPTQCVSIFSGRLGETSLRVNKCLKEVEIATSLKTPLPGIHETGATQKVMEIKVFAKIIRTSLWGLQGKPVSFLPLLQL